MAIMVGKGTNLFQPLVMADWPTSQAGLVTYWISSTSISIVRILFSNKGTHPDSWDEVIDAYTFPNTSSVFACLEDQMQ